MLISHVFPKAMLLLYIGITHFHIIFFFFLETERESLQVIHTYIHISFHRDIKREGITINYEERGIDIFNLR